MTRAEPRRGGRLRDPIHRSGGVGVAGKEGASPLSAGSRGRACAASLRRSAGLGALLIVALPALAESASSAWTMPTAHAPNTFLAANLERFAEDLEAVSAGGIRIEVRSGGRMFAPDDIERAVREGDVPIGDFALSRLASRDPLFGADTVPFLANGYRKAERLWRASRDAVKSRLEEMNLVLLFAVPEPPPVLLARSPLDSESALRELRFRIPSGGAGRELSQMLALARRFGTEPVPAGTWTLADAFEEGRLDVMFLPPAQALGLGAQRFAPYLYPVHPWLRQSVAAMNRGAYETLEPALRDALLDAARAAEERGWRMSRRETQRLLARMEERGFSPSRAPDRIWADVARIRRESTVEWTERTGDDGVAVIQAFYAPR